MSNVTTANDVTTVVDTYLAMWNETDEGRRAEYISSAWTPEGRYVDPLQEAQGHSALSGMVAALHGNYPDHRFRRTSGVDSHHDQVRFGWEFTAPDGKVVVAGIDVGELAGDGKLRKITGFFGPLPEA